MDTWRKKILRYMEDQICMLMVPERHLRFENDVNPELDYYHFSGDNGRGPIQHAGWDPECPGPPSRANRFMAPRNPNPGFNTPLRHFISNPIKNEDLTGINKDNKTPAIYLQVYGGVQDPSQSPQPSQRPQGRLDHSVETMQFVVHGVFRDDSKPQLDILCDFENPKNNEDPDNTRVRKRRSKERKESPPDRGLYPWYGNGYEWQDKKEGCQRIQNLMQYWEDRRLELPSTPPVPEARWHRTMNEQIVDFIDDIEFLLNIANLRSIRVDTLLGAHPPVDPKDLTTLADNDAFISKAWWGTWQCYKMAENNPINVVSLPLIMEVHFPIVRR